MTDEPKRQGRDFWQDHSLRYLEMAFRTDRRERLAGPDGYGKKTGACGDTVEFFLQLKGEHIAAMAYESQGCLNTNACANTVIHLVEGRTLAAAWELTPERVAAYLESLPPDHLHCAELAVGALYLALANAAELRRRPWKKAYRKSR
ncbi:MAG: iron-sulfur cluster assembly scaffold protein [Desulfosarcinaceae bacterium]|nr:iron-sulfur cluster assembly scaffold protein [Desulfosarcinaceae bacterium]